jgi:hypothetical protein
MEQAGTSTDRTPLQDHIPNLYGKGEAIALIEKHGTGVSRTNWGRDHGKY